MRPADFFPFAEEWLCRVCGEPVSTREGVAVVNGGNLAGIAHPDCIEVPDDDEDGSVKNVKTTGGLL